MSAFGSLILVVPVAGLDCKPFNTFISALVNLGRS